MFNCTRITSIEYYTTLEAQAIADGQQINASSASRDAVAYYTDNGAGESQAIWWLRRAARSSGIDTKSSPFSSIADGQIVDERVLRDLAAGRDPMTKISILQQTTAKRTVGYDIQISAPKSVSIFAAFSDPETRARIFAAHDRAFRRALNFTCDDGLIVARRGKGGRKKESVSECAAAIYRHFTSRAGDPHIHSHGILMSCAVRQDLSTGSLDNRDVLRYGGAIAAIYRCELASALKSEFGFEFVRKGRNWEIAGIPESILARFSKRRGMITRAAKEHGIDTAKNREAAQIISLQTRRAKATLPSLVELEDRWTNELESEGWNVATLWRSAEAEARRIKPGDQARAKRIKDLAMGAIEGLIKNEAVFERRALLRHVGEALQTECAAGEMLSIVTDLERAGDVILIATDEGESIYSTAAMIEAERSMLRTALRFQGQCNFIDPEFIEKILEQRPHFREEQREAVRRALNADMISVVEGPAGSGKSMAMEAVATLARSVGELWTIAPSGKATEVIRGATNTKEEMSRAVQRFVRRVQGGEIKLSQRSVILVDESGTLGTVDCAALVDLVAQSSGQKKLVLIGDISQLQPVAAGAPMAALANLLGSSRMNEIQRQESKFQRAASVDFAIGNPARALSAYDQAGAITWAADREDAITKLVTDYVTDRTADTAAASCRGSVTRAVLASWHADVHELNMRIRHKARETGWLTGPDVGISAIPRGGNRPTKMFLAVGDDVIFGETIVLQDVTIRNADIGRISRIEGQLNNPAVTIHLAKGPEITAKVSELVGYRKRGEFQVPRMQHSFAIACHSAQGVTVDACYVANFRRMGRESIYVAMTRHRKSVRLYVDTGRVRDLLATDAPAKVLVKKSGIEIPEDGDERSDPSLIDLKKVIFDEVRHTQRKANASDFVEDVRAWAGVPRKPEANLLLDAASESKAAVIMAWLAARNFQPNERVSPHARQKKHPRCFGLATRMAERTRCPIPYPSNRKIAVKLNMASGKRKIVSKTLCVGSWIDKAETLLSKKSSGEIGSTKQIFKTITDNLVVQIKKVQSMISSLLGRVDARDCWMKLCRLRQSTGRYENAWNPGQEEIAERRRVMLVKYRPTRPLLRTNPQDTNMQSREQNVLPCYALPQPKIG